MSDLQNRAWNHSLVSLDATFIQQRAAAAFGICRVPWNCHCHPEMKNWCSVHKEHQGTTSRESQGTRREIEKSNPIKLVMIFLSVGVTTIFKLSTLDFCTLRSPKQPWPTIPTISTAGHWIHAPMRCFSWKREPGPKMPNFLLRFLSSAPRLLLLLLLFFYHVLSTVHIR